MVNVPKENSPWPEGQVVPYTQFLTMVKQQINSAKEIHDLLVECSKKISESWWGLFWGYLYSIKLKRQQSCTVMLLVVDRVLLLSIKLPPVFTWKLISGEVHTWVHPSSECHVVQLDSCEDGAQVYTLEIPYIARKDQTLRFRKNIHPCSFSNFLCGLFGPLHCLKKSLFSPEDTNLKFRRCLYCWPHFPITIFRLT